MSAPINSEVTLLTEHLTYRPAALIDDIVNSINILAFKATEAVEKGLLSASPHDLGFSLPASTTTPSDQALALSVFDTCKHEIENGVHQLETLLEAKIDKNFDRLEIYALRNILSVPEEIRDWIRLSHYEGLRFTEEEGPTAESVRLQRKKLRETMKLQVLLKAEVKRNERTIRGLNPLLLGQKSGMKKESDEEMEETYPAFAFLQNKGELSGANPVSTTTEFAISQIPALESILDDLGPRLEKLANGDEKEGLVGEDQKTWRRERLEFVEKETRRHLENVRGLELGEQGEVRDGEWQGEGRKLGKGEVEDLERVVAMVGSGQGDPMDTDA